jgi:site-specific DNA-methyltransferase (adenine-specific)
MENLSKKETVSLPKRTQKTIHFDQEVYERYMNLTAIKIGETQYQLKYTEEFRPLAFAEFSSLLYDIAERGILVPIAVDENRNIIDGKHRLISAYILGIKDVPFKIFPNLTDDDKYMIATGLNVYRRHLSKAERDERIIKLRQEGKSYTQIGEALGISDETVRREVVKATATNVGVQLPTMIIGKDGKQRLASIERKKSPSINVSSVAEANRAVQACLAAGEAIPNKAIDLKRLERIGRQTKTNELRQQHCDDARTGTATLLVGDFKERAKEIADESVDVILTDPSYAKEDLPIWNDLGELAKRVLKPSGILLSYSGNLYLPQIFEMLGQNLEYLWMFAIYHSNGNKLIPSVNVHQAWKPVLAYVKPPKNKYWRPFADMVSGGKEKEHHDWQQAVDEAKYYLSHLCPPNAVVLDPMMGSGTVVLAAMQLGFNATGIEIDPAAYATAQERIKQAENIKEELNV